MIPAAQAATNASVAEAQKYNLEAQGAEQAAKTNPALVPEAQARRAVANYAIVESQQRQTYLAAMQARATAATAADATAAMQIQSKAQENFFAAMNAKTQAIQAFQQIFAANRSLVYVAPVSTPAPSAAATAVLSPIIRAAPVQAAASGTSAAPTQGEVAEIRGLISQVSRNMDSLVSQLKKVADTIAANRDAQDEMQRSVVKFAGGTGNNFTYINRLLNNYGSNISALVKKTGIQTPGVALTPDEQNAKLIAQTRVAAQASSATTKSVSGYAGYDDTEDDDGNDSGDGENNIM
jgi:hypothetical protein